MDAIDLLKHQLKALKSGRKGQGVGVLETTIIVIVSAIVLVVGAMIVASVFSSIDTSDYSSSAQTAINKTESMVWSAWAILPISILVVAAVAVIGAVMMLRGRG